MDEFSAVVRKNCLVCSGLLYLNQLIQFVPEEGDGDCIKMLFFNSPMDTIKLCS